MQSKKRNIPKDLDQNLTVPSPLKTKRKQKISDKSHQNDEKLSNSKSKSSKQKTSYDPEELNKTIQEIQDEKFFKKEFAKDLKKFSKFFGKQSASNIECDPTNIDD